MKLKKFVNLTKVQKFIYPLSKLLISFEKCWLFEGDLTKGHTVYSLQTQKDFDIKKFKFFPLF